MLQDSAQLELLRAWILFAFGSFRTGSCQTSAVPVYLNYGQQCLSQHPLTPLSMSVPTNDTPRSAADFTRRMHELLHQARVNILAVQERPAQYANWHMRVYEFVTKRCSGAVSEADILYINRVPRGGHGQGILIP
jgi:hypothetical protein